MLNSSLFRTLSQQQLPNVLSSDRRFTTVLELICNAFISEDLQYDPDCPDSQKILIEVVKIVKLFVPYP